MLFSLVCLISIPVTASGYQEILFKQAEDSIRKKETKFHKTIDRFTASPLYKITYVGIPLIASGLILQCTDHSYKDMRDTHIDGFRTYTDDYLQYLPAIAMVGMKIGGVDGRSSWGRMIVSDAFSVALMAGAVNGLKYTVKRTRPNNRANNSFPSGHTATAFMAATMLSKEYGCRSPWYSIGGYSVATAVGVMRIANNKHWLSDVLVGAGIGIITTELGYFLADLIFKDKGLYEYSSKTHLYSRDYAPSFLGISLGASFPLGNFSVGGKSLDLKTGSAANVEGAYFFNPYIGVGGRLSVSSNSVVYDGTMQEELLGLASGAAGAYFSYPINTRILAGSKLLCSYNHYTDYELGNTRIGDENGFGFGTGINFTYLAKPNFSIKCYADYNLTPSFIPESNRCVSFIQIGGSANISF